MPSNTHDQRNIIYKKIVVYIIIDDINMQKFGIQNEWFCGNFILSFGRTILYFSLVRVRYSSLIGQLILSTNRYHMQVRRLL